MHAEPSNPPKRRRKSRFSAQPDAERAPATDATPGTTSQSFSETVEKKDSHENVPSAVASLRARLKAVQSTHPLTASTPPESSPHQPKTKRRRTRFSAPTRGDATVQVSSVPPTLDLKAIPVAPVSTLRINRAKQQKRKLATLKVSAADLIDENPARNPYYDPALTAQRKRLDRKPLIFTEPGIHAARAQRLREDAAAREKNAKFQESLVRQRQTSSLPILPPRDDELRVAREENVPSVEWWDAPLLKGEIQDNVVGNEQTIAEDMEMNGDASYAIEIRRERITRYIHHPPPIKPTVPPKPPPEIPLMLTKTETKKLRRQRRMEAQNEQQDMVASGLIPTPKPRVKLSNLMRVLASEATADPTKVEAEVRAHAEERRQRHEAENQARKKTKEEKREKISERIEKDRQAGIHASVYRISHMDNPHHRFKVLVNARQLEMTGTLLLFRDCNVVIVEGGLKAQRKYKKLMLRRIDWTHAGDLTESEEKRSEDKQIIAGVVPDAEEPRDSGQGRKVSCVLVWEGEISASAFSTFRTVSLEDEGACRGYLRKHQVEHFWDLCTQANPEGNESLGMRQIM